MTVSNFNLTVEGLQITYSTNGQTFTTLRLCPHAAADLMTECRFIEGFDTEDRTGEPVILFTDSMYGRPVTGYAFWCDFVRTFPLIQRHIERMLEHREERKQHNRVMGKINYLLHPLKATA